MAYNDHPMIADTKRFSIDPEGELDRTAETFVRLNPSARNGAHER